MSDTGDHIIDFGETTFGIQHPSPCRPNLLDCPFNGAAQRLDGPPVAPGRYVCVLDPWGELSIQREASATDVLAITGVVIARETCERILEVLRYVSGGRNFVDVEPYPDAAARLALAELQDTANGQATPAAHIHTDRASALPDPGLDVYDVAGPEPSTDVLVLHDPAGVDINGGYLHRCAESGWSWSDSADTMPFPHIKEGLEWGTPGGSVRERAQGPLVVVRRSAPGDKENARG